MLKVEALHDEVVRALGSARVRSLVELGELQVYVQRTRIVDALQILRDDPKIAMSQLMDVCAVDYPQRPERFEVVYHLLSLRHNRRMRVKALTDEITPLPTATGVFSSAGWYEREVWDMLGVAFSGHPDMRRILTDYGFEGHPLRKDFPVMGFTQVRYDEAQKRVVTEPVELEQGMRTFDCLSPWEGMTDVQLRSDEEGTP